MIEVEAVEKLWIRLPNWVGDCVMASPALRALRQRFPDAEITLFGKPHLLPIYEGSAWHDRAEPYRSGGLLAPVRAGRALREREYDAAVCLPNSFSSALTAWMADIPIRVGYAFQGRGPLLTHSLGSEKRGRLRTVPMVRYYLDLVELLGCSVENETIELPVTDAAREAAETWFREAGVEADEPVVAISPGASFGATKMWAPDRFALVADHFAATRGARILIFHGPAPGDREMAERIQESMSGPALGAGEVIPLNQLCAFMERCDLHICTDSGPRHFGVAARVPSVVLIGPTHPGYTVVDFPDYRLVCLEAECWPCHLKTCPIDHRCMRNMTPEMVIREGESLLQKGTD